MFVIKDLSIAIKKDLRFILQDFNLSLQTGDKVALIGQEGNGKSSLLKAIYYGPEALDYLEIKGEINASSEILGYLPQSLPQHLADQSTQALINEASQNPTFDYGSFYRLLDEMDFPEDRIREDLALGQLSGGEKIKFQILLEMMKEPSLLLLDEPSNDLDLASLLWLEDFIRSATLPVLFISHDETLLAHCANKIVHLELLGNKDRPRHMIMGVGYEDYLKRRQAELDKQSQLAVKEEEEFQAKMARYRKVYERVQSSLRSVSRQDPLAGRNLKDKMHTVKSMGKRFEKEKDNLTEKPKTEDTILVRFHQGHSVPQGKALLDFKLDALRAGDTILAKDIHLRVVGPRKICIIGANGSGKTTLYGHLQQALSQSKTAFATMPQDYSQGLDPQITPVDFLVTSHHKDEITKIRSYLGSLNFTRQEMFRPARELSGGQRAKLFFAKMLLGQAQLLLLDEPTRNLSPLSGQEIRDALADFPGAIIAISHDRRFITEVFDDILELSPQGLKPVDLQDFIQDYNAQSFPKED